MSWRLRLLLPRRPQRTAAGGSRGRQRCRVPHRGLQPGDLAELHELPRRQRAFVADPALAEALCARAAEAGLVVRAYRPGSRVDESGERDAVNVMTWGARVNTGMGNWLSPRAVHRMLPGCGRQAVREVAAAWQVTLSVVLPCSAGRWNGVTAAPIAGRVSKPPVSSAAIGPSGGGIIASPGSGSAWQQTT
ncbi:DUF6919 domain-containing protein [Streptomyces aurantiogriseus]|uniref:DUF6919 domain-containing protein n=1 Tax=Streptomyces aurantiogriseus TaxID=66870 RepID=UPI003570974E